MKLTVLQSNLRRKLATVKPAVAGKSSLPVLSNVLLTATDGRLRIDATNLEIGITADCAAKVENEGAVTVPAQLLSDVINSLPDAPVAFELDERTQELRYQCGRSSGAIKGIEADEFPVIPTADNTPLLSLAPSVLRDIADQVAFAASTEISRPVLTAVLMRVRGDAATFAAADGFRMAIKTITLETPVDEPVDVLIPAKALQNFARVFADVEGNIDVTVTPSGGQVLFHAPDTDCISRLVDGVFPDFERIIPAQHLTRAVVDTATFSKDVKLASYFAAASANIVKLTFDTNGAYTITANASEVGDNQSSNEAIVSGEGGTIALNVQFLQEAVAACKSPQIAIEMQQATHPAVVKPVGSEGYTHICMPMTVR